jgi:DNA-binding NtrC family response regulator
MKNVLVISSNTKTAQLLSRTLSADSLIKNASSTQAALQIHKRNPFDIVFIDLDPPEIASDFDSFGQCIRPFKKTNPLAQFVVVTQKENLQKAFKAAKEDVAGILTHPVEEEEIQQLFESVEAEKPYDVVILDLTIPGGMGGKEAIKSLIEIDPGVKAIVSSGYSDDPVLANFQEYGFKGMLPKPFESNSLGKVLNEVLKGEKD